MDDRSYRHPHLEVYEGDCAITFGWTQQEFSQAPLMIIQLWWMVANAHKKMAMS